MMDANNSISQTDAQPPMEGRHHEDIQQIHQIQQHQHHSSSSVSGGAGYVYYLQHQPTTQKPLAAPGSPNGYVDPTTVGYSYFGAVNTVHEAHAILAACRQGILPRVTRRLTDKERIQFTQPGAVFAWEESEAGIRRWTDHLKWSPSRVSGAFFTYHEILTAQSPLRNGATLIKQSFSAIDPAGGIKMHLVAYTSREAIASGRLPTPSTDPRLKSLVDQLMAVTSLASATGASSILPSIVSPNLLASSSPPEGQPISPQQRTQPLQNYSNALGVSLMGEQGTTSTSSAELSSPTAAGGFNFDPLPGAPVFRHSSLDVSGARHPGVLRQNSLELSPQAMRHHSLGAMYPGGGYAPALGSPVPQHLLPTSRNNSVTSSITHSSHPSSLFSRNDSTSSTMSLVDSRKASGGDPNYAFIHSFGEVGNQLFADRLGLNGTPPPLAGSGITTSPPALQGFKSPSPLHALDDGTQPSPHTAEFARLRLAPDDDGSGPIRGMSTAPGYEDCGAGPIRGMSSAPAAYDHPYASSIRRASVSSGASVTSPQLPNTALFHPSWSEKFAPDSNAPAPGMILYDLAKEGDAIENSGTGSSGNTNGSGN